MSLLINPQHPNLSIGSEHVDLSGVHILGDPKNPAIVMFHSSLSSAKQWQTLTKILVEDYFIVNFDLLGYGKAPKVSNSQEYNLTMETERVYRALNYIIANKPFHIVGHSFGGAVALKIAVENPQSILTMCLFEPVAFHLLKDDSQLFAQVCDFQNKVAKQSDMDGARLFTDTWNETGFFDVLPNKVKQQMADNIDKVKLDFVGLTTEQYDLHACQKIMAPSLLLHGSQSLDISHALVNKLANVLPNVDVCELACGHMGPISHAVDVAAKISSAIKRV